MTDAELAILSIVAEGPIHGYDIQTIITQRGLRAWTNIGVSSMYYVLEKLERQGLIESTSAQRTEGVSRRQYRITPAGFGVLQTAAWRRPATGGCSSKKAAPPSTSMR